MKYLLGIDFGGGASKATLLSVAGEVIASHSVEYPTLYPGDGHVEQDPDDWVLAAKENIRALVSESRKCSDGNIRNGGSKSAPKS